MQAGTRGIWLVPRRLADGTMVGDRCLSASTFGMVLSDRPGLEREMAADTRQDVVSSLQEHRERIRSFGVTRLGLFGSFSQNENRFIGCSSLSAARNLD